MLTACWKSYAGAGRLGLSPAPRGVLGGHRLYRGALFLRRPLTPSALRQHFGSLDPAHEWAALHAAVYPAEPVIMGDAPPGVPSYRVEVARWLGFHVGQDIRELDAHRHWPRRVHPFNVRGLPAALSGSICT